MTTKDHCLFFKDKQNLAINDNLNGQFKNLNLNQNSQRFAETVKSSKNVKNHNKEILNYVYKIEEFVPFFPFKRTAILTESLDYNNDSKVRENSTSFGKTKFANLNTQKDYGKKEDSRKEKTFNANSSTLSLHISAYENSINATTSDNPINNEKDGTNKKKENISSIKSWKTVKKILNESSSVFNYAFELPRQQQDENLAPEVMQFKASQRLSNVNVAPSSSSHTVPSDSLHDFEPPNMPGSSSSPHGSFDFDLDDDVRRPRRAAAAASRTAFVESGTDDEEAGGSKRKKKTTKANKKPAKRARHQTDSSESEEDKDPDMRNLTEKERELQIFKHIEHQELLKTRKEIQQKLMGDVDEERTRPKKKKEETKSAPQPPSQPVASKSDKESGEESSSSDEDVPKTKSPSPQSEPKDEEESEKEEESEEESEVELDTEFHKPSEIAKKMDKKNAIAELVKSRKEKKNNEEKKREQVLEFDKIFGGNSKEEKSESDDSSSSDSSASDSEESGNEADNSFKPQGEEVDRYEQLNEIRLSRHKLAKLCHTPFFDKTVLGCFVRIGVGQVNGVHVYRAAQIVGVVESAKVYNVDGERTNKAIRLKHGPDERVWRLEFASNSEITNSEYLKWRDAMKKAKLPLPTTDYIQKKRNDIVTAFNYNFTDEDVKKMVQQRQKFVTGSTNYAAQKAELLKKKLDSDQSGDIAKSNELQIQIDRIDDIIKKKELERCHDSLGITAINQRNRDTQQRALAEKSLRRISIDTEDDPFTRKSGKSRMVSGRKKGEEGIGNDEKEQTQNIKGGRLSSLKSSSSTTSLNHSASAPQLKFDPTLLMGDVSDHFSTPSPQQHHHQKEEEAPTPPTSTPTTATKPSGGMSFAEFRRRKAGGGN